MTSAAAVEEADERGVITLEALADDGMEVRAAHPVYREVRRNSAGMTRLRRLRGLVANELAAQDTGDDRRIVVRRAALTLESDLEPDPARLVRGRTAVELAGRCAVGGTPERGGRPDGWRARRTGGAGARPLAVRPRRRSRPRDGRYRGGRAIRRGPSRSDVQAVRQPLVHPWRRRGRLCIDAYLAVHAAAMGEAAKACDTLSTTRRR